MAKLEIYGIALLVLLAVACGVYFKGHHDGVESTEDKFAAAALKQADESRAKEQGERDKLLAVSTSYEQQIAQIKIDSLNRPARVVRLCNAPTASVPGTSTATSESQSSPATESSGATGRDIGGAIYDYANDFKACAIQVNSLLEAWPR